MSTRASRAKKPQVVSEKTKKEQPVYATVEAVNVAIENMETETNKVLFELREQVSEMFETQIKAQDTELTELSKKQVNTLIGMNCAVTGTMNVMQQLPGLLRDQNKALWAIRSILGTLVFLVLMTEIVIAIAAFSFIHLK